MLQFYNSPFLELRFIELNNYGILKIILLALFNVITLQMNIHYKIHIAVTQVTDKGHGPLVS